MRGMRGGLGVRMTASSWGKTGSAAQALNGPREVVKTRIAAEGSRFRFMNRLFAEREPGSKRKLRAGERRGRSAQLGQRTGGVQNLVDLGSDPHQRRRIASQFLGRIQNGKARERLEKSDQEIGREDAIGIDAVPGEPDRDEARAVHRLNGEALPGGREMGGDPADRQANRQGCMSGRIVKVKQDTLRCSLRCNEAQAAKSPQDSSLHVFLPLSSGQNIAVANSVDNRTCAVVKPIIVQVLVSLRSVTANRSRRAETPALSWSRTAKSLSGLEDIFASQY